MVLYYLSSGTFQVRLVSLLFNLDLRCAHKNYLIEDLVVPVKRFLSYWPLPIYPNIVFMSRPCWPSLSRNFLFCAILYRNLPSLFILRFFLTWPSYGIILLLVPCLTNYQGIFILFRWQVLKTFSHRAFFFLSYNSLFYIIAWWKRSHVGDPD